MWEPNKPDVHHVVVSSRSSLEAASEAAKRINALLVAQGVVKPSQIAAAAAKSKPIVRYTHTYSYLD